MEETIFSKLRENLLGQTLTMTLEIKEPWGDISSSLQGSHYFRDLGKNRLEFWGGVNLQLWKGLSLGIYGQYSRINDQLSLPKAGASLEDILLQKKMLATDYNYGLSVGVELYVRLHLQQRRQSPFRKMTRRKIVAIDRALCDGCGLCTTACAEGALVLDEERKAVLPRELYCDGLGACLDVCPTGALRVEERDVDDYDPAAAFDHVLAARGREAASRVHGASAATGAFGPAGCPGSAARDIPAEAAEDSPEGPGARAKSRLSQWPIQLHLVSPLAPYFQGADLLVAADCTAFALGSFHGDLLKGKKLVIACPKLDDCGGYVEKLAEIIRRNGLRSLTVVIMTVPCCSGLFRLVQLAVEASGIPIEVRKIVIGIDGKIVGPQAGRSAGPVP